MKIVLLTSKAANQRALAHRLAKEVELAGVVVSDNVPKKKAPASGRALAFARKVENRTVGWPFSSAWKRMMAHYDGLYPQLPATRTVRVKNVNDAETLRFLDGVEPDAILVSGTNLVGKAIIERGARVAGVLNLHTGISPYVKGGPNCTNWCLAENALHLIGSTVMWIDLGIDSGDLIATERAPLSGSESLFALHRRVMDHAHDLYVRVVKALACDGTLPRIKQSAIVEGRTFFTREWDAFAMARALKNFYSAYRPDAFSSVEFLQKSERMKMFPA